MSNQHKTIEGLVGTKVRHDFSRNIVGTITKTRDDIRGYAYYVEWENAPEHNDWYALTRLEKLNTPNEEVRNAE